MLRSSTLFVRTLRDDPADAEVLPEEWLSSAPGRRLTSVMIRVAHMPETEAELEATVRRILATEARLATDVPISRASTASLLR